MQLSDKTLRLIAVGASMAANCQPCLQGNLAKARSDGCDEQEIAEAIWVGKMVRRGAASKMDVFAASLIPDEAGIGERNNQASQSSLTAEPAEEGCGCK